MCLKIWERCSGFPEGSGNAVKARYRFKKREITKTGGRIYYLKPVSKKRWIDKKVPEWTAALDDDRSD